ncbi:MAG: DUF547 domain-containing protein [candidate division KSB1 bacterium]|nr:DUF547 domain-containing protein [candidate division KSB1 bacterium]MDZ7367304.1 DUF547 domain-containing protein [candidate division KSB1 bacterium]MDZ7405857.1 DUF547 domain-containing protein [candidate division KSB1 bacterium]
MSRVLRFQGVAKTVFKILAVFGALILAAPSHIFAASAKADSLGPDYSLFSQVLRDHVKNGAVNYKALKTDKRLTDFVEMLKKTDPNKISAKNRLAFWINVYNAFVLKVVVDQYPIKSIMNKTAYALGKSNFQKKLVTINGVPYSLNDVENDIIRPMGDPRIHFAINCAAKSCPPLRSEAFEPRRLDEQLEEQTRQFINNPEKNSFDFAKKEALVSKIFDWFEEDFKKYDKGVPAFIGRYLPAEQGQQLLANAKIFKIKHHDYNWDLNE